MNDKSRTKNSIINVIYSFILQFSKIILVFVNRIIFVKILGATYLGINGIFNNVLGILSLADFGITTAMMYSLYKPLAQKDEKKISQYINYFNKIYNIIAIFVAVLGLMLVPFLKHIINLPTNVEHIYLYYMLMLLSTVVSYLFVYQTTLLVADQKQYITNRYDIIFQYIIFILQVIVLVITKNYALYLSINIVCTVICNLFKVRKTKEIYPYLQNRKRIEPLEKNDKKEVFSNMSSLFFYKLGSVIQSNTDNILISIFVGTISVGYYSNYNTIITSIVTLITMVFTSIKASLGNFLVEKSKETQLKMFYILEEINFGLICFSAVAFLNLIPDFIEICFGKEYVLSQAVLIATVLNFYTSNIRQTMWAYRETAGLFKRTKFITIITSILNIIFSIILGKYYGLVGIIMATVLSRMLYAWWREPLITFNEYFGVSASTYFKNYIFRFILFVLIAYITMRINSFVRIENLYLSFAVKVVITSIIPTIILFFIALKGEAFKFIRLKIKKKEVQNEK